MIVLNDSVTDLQFCKLQFVFFWPTPVAEALWHWQSTAKQPDVGEQTEEQTD